jgi:hypothetical protein
MIDQRADLLACIQACRQCKTVLQADDNRF